MQIFIFIICMFCGILSGIVYDVLYVARCFVCGTDKSAYTVKDKIFLIAADVLYCLVFAAGFVFVSVMFVYLKSFHIIVAFLINKAYNKFTKFKEKHVEKRKKNPHVCRGDGKRHTFNLHSRRSGNLSARGNHRRYAPKGANSNRNSAS